MLNGHDRHTRTTASAGALRRIGVLGLVAGTCAAMAAFIPGGAQAAPSGSSAARAVNVQLGAGARVSPALGTVLAGLTASASTPLVDAPSATGSRTSEVGLAADVARLADVSTGDVAATSTRRYDATTASSRVAGAHVSLFGTNVLTAGAVTSSATCDAGATPTASARTLNLTVGRTTLDATVGASATVAVTVPGLVGANVEVTVASPHAVTTTSATATGLQVDLDLHAKVLAGLVAVEVPLGSVSLAASTCATPAALPVTTPPVDAAPTLTGLTPTSGPTAGDQTVHLTGTSFTAGTTVAFDGAPATDVTVTSTTSLTAVTPAHPAGPVQAEVTTAAGTSGTKGYTYVPPTVTAIDPSRGPTAGGQPVTITGSGFGPGSTVTIGGAPATDVAVDAAGTSITATTPAGTAGPADVVVDGPGSPAATLSGGYTYLAPTGTSIEPDRGPTAGGQVVTISGSGFGPDSTVTIGGAPATHVSVNGAGTAITATTPAGTAGPADVVVSDPGTTPVTLSGAYTYVPPAITGLDPSQGPTSGGQVVTISGSGFGPDSTVTIGGAPATDVSVNDAGTAIAATTPPGPAGPADVVVSDAGTTPVTLAGGYTYVPPAVTAIDPNQGPTSGGQVVTIAGSGFGPGSTVTFGGAPATDVSVNDAGTAVTATTPAGTAGPVDVVVGDAGTAPVTLAGGYTYVPPAVTAIDPNQGPTSGGQVVTIAGSGFGPSSTVSIGGAPATDVSVSGDGTAITATTPAGTAGAVDVVVADPGSPTVTLPGGYRYVPPAATAIDPDQGPTAGGQTVTVSGSGFGPGSTVSIGGAPATDVSVNDAGTAVTATTPAGTVGTVDVVVADAGGPDATLTGGYTYDPAPTVTGMSPASGSPDGGQVITITGTGFMPGSTTIALGSRLAKNIAVVSPTEVTAVTPAGSGAPHLVVTTPGGTTTSPTVFTYVEGERSAQGPGGSSLPFTGIDTAEITGVGGWFVATGAWAFLFGSRRRRRT